MGQITHHVEQLVIPVAGAFNCGLTARVHLESLIASLQAGPERIVTKPIVPAHFGLHHLDRVQDKFADELHDLTDTYPDAKVVIVGHSLGGLLGRTQNVHGLVTIGTPHEGTRRGVPGFFRRQYEAFSQNPPAEQIGSVAMIGSFIDELVPQDSALASSRMELAGQRYATNPFLMHNALPVWPGVRALTARLVDEMFAAEKLSLPDLAESA